MSKGRLVVCVVASVIILKRSAMLSVMSLEHGSLLSHPAGTLSYLTIEQLKAPSPYPAHLNQCVVVVKVA